MKKGGSLVYGADEGDEELGPGDQEFLLIEFIYWIVGIEDHFLNFMI